MAAANIVETYRRRAASSCSMSLCATATNCWWRPATRPSIAPSQGDARAARGQSGMPHGRWFHMGGDVVMW